MVAINVDQTGRLDLAVTQGAGDPQIDERIKASQFLHCANLSKDCMIEMTKFDFETGVTVRNENIQ
ncbi:hypothetical protein ACTMU2_17490 [Cupriavidus basilensis]